jgi:diguanylate cyclase (GGDEF)-like protein/PAS domain S-box-containing protein
MTALAIVGLARANLVGDLPIPALLGMLAVGSVSAHWATRRWEKDPTVRQLHALLAVQMFAVTLVVYAIGWGPTLSIGYLFVFAGDLEEIGARVWRPALGWSLTGIAVGQAAIALGWVHTYVPVPYVHGLAVLSGLGVAFFAQLMGTKTAAQEVSASQLRESEATARQLFAENPQPMWVYDQETLAFLEVNQAAIDHYGYSHDEFLNRTIIDIRPTDDTTRLVTEVTHREALQHSGMWRHRRKNGELIDVEITSHRLAFQGQPAVLVAIQDITDRLQAQRALRASEAWFRSLFEHSTDVAMIMDRDWEIRYVTPSIRDVLSLEPGSCIGSDARELFGASNITFGDGDSFERLRTPGAVVRLTVQVVGPAGSHWVDATIRNMLDDRDVGGYVANLHDVTDRFEQLAAVRRSDARLQAIVARSSDLTMFFGSDGTIKWASPACETLLGFTANELIGQNGLELIDSNDQSRVVNDFAALGDAGSHVRTQFRVTNAAGQTRWIEEVATNLVDDPDVGYIVGNLRDITDTHELQDELAHRALHNTLTQLPNRRSLHDTLTATLERSRATRQHCALIMIDLNEFKLVNDSLGHAAGDDTLKIVAERLERSVHDTDFVAHLGGDEFIVLIDSANQNTAAGIARRLQQLIAQPIALDHTDVHLTASIGLALSDSSRNAEELLRNADIAMYRAKSRGDGRPAIFNHALADHAQHDFELQRDLHRALSAETRGPSQFELNYQPILNLRTGQIDGMEALVRWHRTTETLEPPDVFIPIAERTGLIIPLGREILRLAMTDIRKWKTRGLRLDGLSLAVNISARQLTDRALPNHLARLANTLPSPHNLVVEVTESAYQEDIDHARGLIDWVRALGAFVSIDDFGTGFSSLARLKDFPVDCIKIDKMFIDGLPTDTGNSKIVTAILAMAETLDLRVVAEGVESLEQLECLRMLGCRYVQGFAIARPESADAFAQRIADDQHRPGRVRSLPVVRIKAVPA